MGNKNKNKNTPVVEETAGVTPETAPVVEETLKAEIIPSGNWYDKNGDEFEFTVSQFTFKGKVYTKEEVMIDHPDVLEHLASVKSFILKKL